MNSHCLRNGLAMVVLVATSQCIFAQADSLDKENKLSIGMNFLTHGETCAGGLPRTADNYKEPEERSNFLLGRFRLNVDYERQGIQAHATLQNKAVWGTSGNTALKLYEGWVKLTARNGLFAQLGRVALSYDDERIIGPNDFAMMALSHDVLRVGYEGHGHKAHAILAYNQNAENVYSSTYYYNGAQPYKSMQTVWYHYDVPKVPLGASLLFMNVGLQAGVPDHQNNLPRTEYQQMWGGYVNYHPKFLTLEGSYYRQTGQDVDGTMCSTDIDAWMASVLATVTPTERYGFKMGYDYLSGDDYVPVIFGGTLGLVHHDKERGFNPLFGSKNKFYGMMDYFYESAYTQGFTPGLQNAFVGVFGNPTDKLKCSLDYHYLAVATDLDGLNRTLGHSLELQTTYQFTKDVSFTAGYTFMVGTETMDRLKQGNSSKYARWGWFSLVISPRLFTTKW